MPTKPLRVVLADDHELVLEGLRSLLANEPDIAVVGTATNGANALTVIAQTQPDVAVLDVQMPDLDGLECLAHIRQRNWPVRVLLLTAFSDGEAIQSALAGGADGFALKTAAPRQTVEAIRQIGQGYLVFPPAARKWLGGQANATEAPTLSSREWQVLEHLARGLTNAQIAETMVVSENTVKFHLQNIFQKLGVSNRTEAAAFYLRTKRG